MGFITSYYFLKEGFVEIVSRVFQLFDKNLFSHF